MKMSERRTTTMMRLFGVNIAVDLDHDDSSTQTDYQDQGIKTIDEITSRKRKTRSPNYQEEDDDDYLIPKRPKILRLFGVDIAIDHLFTTSTSSQQDQLLITQNPNIQEEEEEAAAAPAPMPHNPEEEAPAPIPRNPNQEEAAPAPMQHNPEQEEEEEAAPAPIPQNPNQEEEEEAEAAAPAPIPRNPNQEEAAPAPMPHNPEQEEEEEAAPAPIPQNPNQEEEEEEEEAEAAAPAPIPPHPRLLFRKELTDTDVARGHNRLLITGSHILMAALTEEERRKVEVNEGDFLRVPTRDINGVEYTLRLKRWTSLGAIVLKHQWGKLVRANRLQRGDSVRGYGYRVDGEFRLLLIIIRNQLN